MKTIWKYPIGLESTHEMPDGAEFLFVEQQGDANDPGDGLPF